MCNAISFKYSKLLEFKAIIYQLNFFHFSFNSNNQRLKSLQFNFNFKVVIQSITYFDEENKKQQNPKFLHFFTVFRIFLFFYLKQKVIFIN